MGDHFVQVCQYGYTHGQCRCASPNKSIRRVECDQIKHAQNPKPGKHGVEYTEPPPSKPVAVRFDGDGFGVTAGPFGSRAEADEWYALAAALVRESSADFIVMTDPEDALSRLRR